MDRVIDMVVVAGAGEEEGAATTPDPAGKEEVAGMLRLRATVPTSSSAL
jgi:hypothetical protein